MKHVVSFSGGRTSAYLVWLIVVKLILKGVSIKDIAVIFMDTGAEHPKTYEFIKNIVKYFNINLICLQPKTTFELGIGNTYDIVSINDIRWDLKLWADLLKKYGRPSAVAGFCTDRMKEVVAIKYCNDTFGKGNYYSWLGMRHDEPKRLVGNHNIYDKSAYKQLIKQGLDDYDISELFCQISEDIGLLNTDFSYIHDETKELLISRIKKQHKIGLRYLAQISKADKEEILNWWGEQPFNLEIPEYLGNCVFCVKKGVNKIALAAKDEPELLDDFLNVIESHDARILPSRRDNYLDMYRGNMSLRQIIEAYKDISREELFNNLRSSKRFESGSCSESCEIFNDDQLDLFKEI